VGRRTLERGSKSRSERLPRTISARSKKEGTWRKYPLKPLVWVGAPAKEDREFVRIGNE